MLYLKLAEVARGLGKISFEKRQGAITSREAYDRMALLLNPLSVDEIIGLQAIMYLGMDSEFEPEDKTPFEIFSERKKTIEAHSSFEREYEISSLIEKIHLDNYLRRGYHKLGLSM